MTLFFLQLRAELRKMFARKRTYIGFGAFLFIEVLTLFLLRLPKVQNSLRHLIEQAGYASEQYFSGLTLAFFIVTTTVVLLGGLYLALVSGDVVSKEIEEGTMRMMLCRPVSRLRILTVKYLACIIYTVCLIAFIGLSALGVSIARQGMGGLFVFSPFDNIYALYEFGPGVQRYLGALALLSMSLISVSSLGFALSCCNMKPAAATIITLSVLFLDSILRNIPYFECIRHWFITTHMATWINVMRPEIPVWRMIEDYGYLLGANATFVIVGALIFLQRDLKG